jgi:hypothetical protein
MDNKLASSNCLINVGLPNNGGHMNGDQNTFVANSFLTADGYTFVSQATVPTSNSVPAWFPLAAISGEGEAAQCSNLNGVSKGVDLTSKSKVTIKATGAPGATLEFFLGGEGQWGPSSSSYNTGSGKGITASYTFTSSNEETFNFDFSVLDATVWAGWAGKNKIQSVGFASKTDGATFKVSQVLIGADANTTINVDAVSASSFSVFPNPASDVVNVVLASSDAATVELADLAGQVVSSQAVNGTNLVAVSTSNVTSGVYVVNVRSANGVATQKVVVK